MMQPMETEAELWQAIVAHQGEMLYTASGLPFRYSVKQGKNGQPTRELIVDRRKQSKTLTWSSIRVAFARVLADKNAGRDAPYNRPKGIGDIRGISYIYPLLWRFGVIQVPEAVAEKMRGE